MPREAEHIHELRECNAELLSLDPENPDPEKLDAITERLSYTIHELADRPGPVPPRPGA